jgi:dihydrofolate reductase
VKASISLIAAVDRNHVIGRDGGIPWRLPADFAFFKKTTLGKPIIMGRKTWESLPAGALPGRINIIVTRDKNYSAKDAVVVNNPQQAIQAAGNVSEIMVIGGAQLYKLFWDKAQTIYLSEADAEVENGDAFFPEINKQEWEIKQRQNHPADEKNQYTFEVVTYERLPRAVNS